MPKKSNSCDSNYMDEIISIKFDNLQLCYCDSKEN